jgi:hypothetical protein
LFIINSGLFVYFSRRLGQAPVEVWAPLSPDVPLER